MKTLTTEILVIGGGVTGAGVAWDAALRGFDVILVEQRDVGHGTSGRFHGLLHSGGRYAVKDAISAQECIHENRILRQTHAHCIEDTGGFFVVTPEDAQSDYPQRFVQGCAQAGIPCDEISVAAALRLEPRLNPAINQVFAVPDASVDGFKLIHATMQAARLAGARIFTYHQVVSLLVAGDDDARRVIGAQVQDVVRDERVLIHAALVINAAGAWSGRIAAMADVSVAIVPGKGVMLATAHRLVNRVINRCKWPGDGDILVPAHTVSIIGTTDTAVSDLEHLTIEEWEIQKMLTEGEKMIPGFAQTRILRAWAGVRPLYRETAVSDDRDISRKFTLLNHHVRDGVARLITITGGKLTTFRMMAERTVDLAAAILGPRRPCTTASTPVPGAEKGAYWLGHRLQDVERNRWQNQLICECELVTRGMLEDAVRQNPTVGLDDLRRDVRLGMGPCQGGFCTYRAVGVVHELKLEKGLSAETGNAAWASEQGGSSDTVRASQLYNPNLLLRDFLQERWKGVRPIVWGQQLKQEALDQLIYLSILNADHLPDAQLKSPLSDFYHQESTDA